MNDSQYVIKHDVIDRMVYDGLLEQAPALGAVIYQGQERLKTFGALSSDVFFSLYKPVPEFNADVAPEYLFNKEELTKMLDSSAYKELREYTVLDELGSGLGSKALLEDFMRNIQTDDSMQEIAEKVNVAKEAQKVAETFEEAAKEFDAAMQQAREAVEEIKRLLESQQSNLRRFIENAAGHAVQEVEAVNEAVVSWGLDKGGFERLPIDKKLALLSVLKDQKKFREMGKVVGRMRNIAISSRKLKCQSTKVELHSITTGNDISRLLPQELAALRNPSLKKDFYRRFSEKQLMQYDLRHNEQKGQGPIIALIDSSGSMRKDHREEWSKAVALGLAEIAAREHRSFAYALFASARDELIGDEFTRGYPSPEQLVQLATSFIGGGTDFEKPLKYAVGKLNESKFNKADIVLITDGTCAVSDEFLANIMQEKSIKEFRIYSVLVGGHSQELNRFSDAVWNLQELMDDTVVKELFAKM